MARDDAQVILLGVRPTPRSPARYARYARRNRVSLTFAVAMASVAITTRDHLTALMALLAGTETEFAKSLTIALEKGAAGQVEATKTGTVEELAVFINAAASGTKFMVGIHSDSAGTPGTVLAEKEFTRAKVSEFFKVTGFSVSVTSGTKYWLSVVGLDGSVIVREEEGAAKGKIYKTSNAIKELSKGTWVSLSELGPLSFYATGKETGGEQVGKGTGALSVGARLSAVSAKIALALGSLSVGVQLTGTAGQTVRQATGSLSVGARITGTPGQSTRTGKGALSVGVRFTGVGKKEGAEQVGKAVGSLSVGARFSPTSVGVHAGAGALSVGPRLAPTSASVRSAAGSLHVGARLTPSASKVARGAGTLSCGARLSASYSTIRKASSAVHVGVQLTGTGHVPTTDPTHKGIVHVGPQILGVGHKVLVTPQPPLGIPLSGHVSVGQTGRLSRQTGKLGTPTSGRAH